MKKDEKTKYERIKRIEKLLKNLNLVSKKVHIPQDKYIPTRKYSKNSVIEASI